MTCDDLRKSATEGAPLDEAARAHLADCAACGDEFPELRALTSAHPAAPDALRERVLASFPTPRTSRWPEFIRAAAVLVIGIGVGFISGFQIKPAREIMIEVPGPTVTVERPVDKPVSDDYVSNVAIAAERIYGPRKGEPALVEVTYVPNSVRIRSIVVDPKVKEIEQYCPVARQLGSLAAKRPDVVVYKKKEY